MQSVLGDIAETTTVLSHFGQCPFVQRRNAPATGHGKLSTTAGLCHFPTRFTVPPFILRARGKSQKTPYSEALLHYTASLFVLGRIDYKRIKQKITYSCTSTFLHFSKTKAFLCVSSGAFPLSKTLSYSSTSSAARR